MGKKIVIMYDSFSEQGGVERIMFFQARALRKAGYEVSFAFAHIDEKLRQERLKEFPVIEYAKLPFKNETLQICSSVIRNSQDKLKDFDLIICHYFPSSYIALRARKKFSIPYILHIHHPPQFLYNADLNWAKNTFKRQFSFTIGKIFRGILRKFDNHCVKNANDYILECKAVERIAKDTYGIAGTVIYPTIESAFTIKKTNFSEVSKYGINKNYILGSGRIIKQKRFDYLIKAFPKLKNKNLRLVLVGKYNDETKKELMDLALINKIDLLLLGPLDKEELIKLYSLAKVVVLTCPKEWFGLVPIEAMACGCPVVAWKDNFGPQETVIEGLNGFLAKPYEIDDLASKIDKAIEKKWDKAKIRASVKKFSEKNQSQILLKFIKKFFKTT